MCQDSESVQHNLEIAQTDTFHSLNSFNTLCVYIMVTEIMQSLDYHLKQSNNTLVLLSTWFHVSFTRKCGYSSNTQLHSSVVSHIIRGSTRCPLLCPKLVRGAVKVVYFHTTTHYLSLSVTFYTSACNNTRLPWQP